MIKPRTVVPDVEFLELWRIGGIKVEPQFCPRQ